MGIKVKIRQENKTNSSMRTGDRSKSAKPTKKTKNNFRVGRPQTVKLKNNTEQVNSAQRPFTALPNVVAPAKYIGLNPPKTNKLKNKKEVHFTELKTKVKKYMYSLRNIIGTTTILYNTITIHY